MKEEKGFRVGVVPSQSGTSINGILDVASACVIAGAEGIFASDHITFMGGPTRISWPVCLGAIRGNLGEIPVGPLVARCGVGADHLIKHNLLSLAAGGHVIANLGVGDTRGKKEQEALGLPWPERQQRENSAIETANFCVDQGWETYIATSSNEFLERFPPQVGVHEQEGYEAGFTTRRKAWSFWGETNALVLTQRAFQERWSWVILAQRSLETPQDFITRLENVLLLRDRMG